MAKKKILPIQEPRQSGERELRIVLRKKGVLALAGGENLWPGAEISSVYVKQIKAPTFCVL